jgi:hypothetical protein
LPFDITKRDSGFPLDLKIRSVFPLFLTSLNVHAVTLTSDGTVRQYLLLAILANSTVKGKNGGQGACQLIGFGLQ